MSDLSSLALFAVACLALASLPGPDMLLIASRSAAQGRAAGFATLAGIQVGTYCHTLACALGLAQLFAAVPTAYDIVRYIGAAYLLYLAFKTVRSGESLLRPEAERRRFSIPQVFRQGLFTNLLNPKMALFVLALFPQFVRPSGGSVVGQMLVLATILNLIGLMVNGTVILAASKIARIISRRLKFQRAGHYLLGTVFAGLALRLAYEKSH